MMCRVLEVSRSGYYASRSRPPSLREAENETLTTEIESIHREFRLTYGSPRIHEELRERGHAIGKNRVARLMRERGIQGVMKRRFRPRTTDSKHGLPTASNILDRKFDVSEPNKVWAGDITYIETREGWLYLAVVLDLYSRKVVGWSMADHMRTEIVEDALRMATGNRMPSTTLMHHSDRGSQYASHSFQRLLAAKGIQCSMSRKGECYDNAVVESFFGTLKNELIYRKLLMTRDEARSEIHNYIEVFYNRKRRHSSIGYSTPVGFEDNYAAA